MLQILPPSKVLSCIFISKTDAVFHIVPHFIFTVCPTLLNFFGILLWFSPCSIFVEAKLPSFWIADAKTPGVLNLNSVRILYCYVLNAAEFQLDYHLRMGVSRCVAFFLDQYTTSHSCRQRSAVIALILGRHTHLDFSHRVRTQSCHFSITSFVCFFCNFCTYRSVVSIWPFCSWLFVIDA